MKPNLLIAWRFLSAQPRSIAMGVAGIALGVAFFVLTQAQTAGFEKFFIQTILGTNGAIKIAEKYQNPNDFVGITTASGEDISFWRPTERAYVDGVDYPGRLAAEISKVEGVSGISEVVEGPVQFTAAGRTVNTTICGIRLFDHLRVSSLAGQIVEGDLAHFSSYAYPVMIGRRLADRLAVQVGQKIILNANGQTTQADVVAIFQTGAGDIDLQRVYLPLLQARTLLQKPFEGSYLQLGVNDPAKAPAIAKGIAAAYGYHAVPWQEREKVWLEVFGALRLSAGLTVCSILAIAAMGIFNTLAMMVIEKTRQISILMAYGYTARDIRSIFLWQGSFLGAAGAAAGVLGGIAATWIVEHLPIRIRGIFATDHFVVSWDIRHYILAVVLALIAVFAATLWPSRRAAALQPADVLRGSSN